MPTLVLPPRKMLNIIQHNSILNSYHHEMQKKFNLLQEIKFMAFKLVCNSLEKCFPLLHHTHCHNIFFCIMRRWNPFFFCWIQIIIYHFISHSCASARLNDVLTQFSTSCASWIYNCLNLGWCFNGFSLLNSVFDGAMFTCKIKSLIACVNKLKHCHDYNWIKSTTFNFDNYKTGIKFRWRTVELFKPSTQLMRATWLHF